MEAKEIQKISGTTSLSCQQSVSQSTSDKLIDRELENNDQMINASDLLKYVYILGTAYTDLKTAEKSIMFLLNIITKCDFDSITILNCIISLRQIMLSNANVDVKSLCIEAFESIVEYAGTVLQKSANKECANNCKDILSICAISFEDLSYKDIAKRCAELLENILQVQEIDEQIAQSCAQTLKNIEKYNLEKQKTLAIKDNGRLPKVIIGQHRVKKFIYGAINKEECSINK